MFIEKIHVKSRKNHVEELSRPQNIKTRKLHWQRMISLKHRRFDISLTALHFWKNLYSKRFQLEANEFGP